MARLVYTAITSVDGYVADADGSFDWAAPDEEVHAFANDLERTVGTHLLGRRMYEVMKVWDQDEMITGQAPVVQDFAALWRQTDKIVFSRTLSEVDTARTRLVSHFDAEAVRELKAQAEADVSVGGPHLAAEAFAADLVDEVGVLVVPVSVGAGTPFLPAARRVDLDLLDTARLGGGVVYLRYRVRTAG